jgi:hypothetical protein
VEESRYENPLTTSSMGDPDSVLHRGLCV